MKKNIQGKSKNKPIKDSISEEDDDEEFSSYRHKKSQSSSRTPVIDSFSRDLTKMAEDGKLDPIVGRHKEIERVSQILSRRKKNNPILLGEPGCVAGETFIEIRKISDLGNHNIIVVEN